MQQSYSADYRIDYSVRGFEVVRHELSGEKLKSLIKPIHPVKQDNNRKLKIKKL